MKILVTGGLGFIGSHFAESAILQGHDVSIVDKLTYAGHLQNIQDFRSKIRDVAIMDIASPQMFDFIKTNNFDTIINFAAESHVDRSLNNGLTFTESNVLGVTNILEAQKSGFFEKFIQVSTDEVYGTIAAGSWKEISPLDPRSPYSASKASAELHCNAYRTSFGLNITITRSANNYGPRQSVEKFIPVAISKLVIGNKVPIYGNGENIREWVHVSDHVGALLTLSQSAISGVFNIGGESISNLELAKRICQYMNITGNQFEFVSDRLGHDFRYSVDDELIKESVGWKRNFGLAEGLGQTIEWYLENQEWVTNSMKRML